MKPKLYVIDIYIIKKFLGTFFLCISLIVSIAIVFDIAENIDDFLSKDATLKQIVVDYYFNFIPYFANLFSSLFTFVAVIYFTSKMAYDTEIIAIMSSGVSFHRLVRPYMIGALIVASFSYFLGNYIIPPANKKRVEFRNTYIGNKRNIAENNIHRQLTPGTYIYMRSYVPATDIGHKFTMEKIEDGELKSKLTADFIKWDRERKIWQINNFYIREINGHEEKITKGTELDTLLNMKPEDYRVMKNIVETMSLPILTKEIQDLRLRGVNTVEYELERHRRTSNPFSLFILTIIGVSLASKKIKGGLGFHLGLGILISFSYILFMQVTSVFSNTGLMSPLVAVWVPNLFFSVVALFLYRHACK